MDYRIGHKKVYCPVLDWYVANDLAAVKPEMWALEGLRELQQQLVILPLVNRDYDSMFQKPGDVVNLHDTANFTAVRKQRGSKVSQQQVVANDNTVRLNQQLHVAFYLDDYDMKDSLINVMAKYGAKAGLALAEAIDGVILGESPNFFENAAGKIGTDIDDQMVRNLAEIMTRNLCPRSGRQLVLGAASENMVLGEARFVEAQMIGNGQAILNNQLGFMRGFNIFVGSQVPEVAAGTPLNVTNTVNGAHPAGSTTIAVTEGISVPKVGDYLTIAGDAQPHRITAYASPNATITPALRYAVLTGAVISIPTSGTVNLVAGYAFQFSDPIKVSGFADGELKIGQGISFNDSNVYTIIGISIVGGNVDTITLNRPLDAAIANGDDVFPMPSGNYNLAFLRDAITFVNRPMAPAMAGTGVMAAVMNDGGVAIRVTIGYDQDYLGYRVVYDTLCGVRTLNTDMGAVLLS